MFFGRSKNKIVSPDNLSQIFDEYIKDKEKDSPYNISKSVFINVNNYHLNGITEGLLSGKEYVMPLGLGRIAIYKKKASGFRTVDYFIDWQKTVAAGKRVYHLNEHSDGYNYSISWIRGHRIRNIELYRFIPTRRFKRH